MNLGTIDLEFPRGPHTATHQAGCRTILLARFGRSRFHSQGSEKSRSIYSPGDTNNFSVSSVGFPGGSVVKNPSASAGGPREASSILGLGRSPGEGNGNTPEFLPGKSHGQRSLVGYNPWGRKELNTAKHIHTQGFQLTYYYLLNAVNSLWHWYPIFNSTIPLPRLTVCQVPCYQCPHYLPGGSEIVPPSLGCNSPHGCHQGLEPASHGFLERWKAKSTRGSLDPENVQAHYFSWKYVWKYLQDIL